AVGPVRLVRQPGNSGVQFRGDCDPACDSIGPAGRPLGRLDPAAAGVPAARSISAATGTELGIEDLHWWAAADAAESGLRAAAERGRLEGRLGFCLDAGPRDTGGACVRLLWCAQSRRLASRTVE